MNENLFSEEGFSMACTQSNLTSGQMSVITPTNIQSASLSGSRRLMVSDNPETLNSTTFSVTRGTLWHDYVNTSNTTVLHRVFVWHLNNTGGTVKIGLTVQNLSSTNTIELQSVKRERRSNNSDWTLTAIPETLVITRLFAWHNLRGPGIGNNLILTASRLSKF
jgi:hypothetical protein